MAHVSRSTISGHSRSAKSRIRARNASSGTMMSSTAASSGMARPVAGHSLPPLAIQDSMAWRSYTIPVEAILTGSRKRSSVMASKKSLGAPARRANSPGSSSHDAFGESVSSAVTSGGIGPGGADGGARGRGESGGVAGADMTRSAETDATWRNTRERAGAARVGGSRGADTRAADARARGARGRARAGWRRLGRARGPGGAVPRAARGCVRRGARRDRATTASGRRRKRTGRAVFFLEVTTAKFLLVTRRSTV